MSKEIKIIEIHIEERVQLNYCGKATFQYYNEEEFSPVIETIEVTEAIDFDSCMTFLKTEIRELVSSKRAKDFMKQRKSNGWIN